MCWILICISNHSPFDVRVCAYWNAIKVIRWSIERHAHAPKAVKDVVLTMTMIRSIAAWSSISLLPNELLFLIFELLDFGSILRASRARPRRHLQQQHLRAGDESSNQSSSSTSHDLKDDNKNIKEQDKKCQMM